MNEIEKFKNIERIINEHITYKKNKENKLNEELILIKNEIGNEFDKYNNNINNEEGNDANNYENNIIQNNKNLEEIKLDGKAEYSGFYNELELEHNYE